MHARLVLAVLVACVVPLVLGVGPAAACSCAAVSDKAALKGATAVFTGDVIAYEEVGDPRDRGANVWTFAARRVFKGKVEPVVKVISGGPCGIELPRTGRFLMYTSESSTPETRRQLQERLADIEKQIDELQRPLRDAEARLGTSSDPKARSETQSVQDAEAAGVGQLNVLEQQRDRIRIRLIPPIADIKLAASLCSGSRAVGTGAGPSGPNLLKPVPPSFGSGVAPRGIETEVPAPPQRLVRDRLASWWTAGALGVLATLGTWALKTRRRRSSRS